MKKLAFLEASHNCEVIVDFIQMKGIQNPNL